MNSPLFKVVEIYRAHLSIGFVAFDTFRNLLQDDKGKISGPRTVLAGLGAGVSESLFAVTPFESIKTTLIDDRKSGNPRMRGFLHGSKIMFQERGVRGFFQGFVPTTARQAANSAVRFGSYTTLKQLAQSYVAPGEKLGTVSTFGIGATAGVITVMQSIEARKEYKNTFACAARIFREEGVLAFWSGALPRLARLMTLGTPPKVNFKAKSAHKLMTKLLENLKPRITHLLIAFPVFAACFFVTIKHSAWSRATFATSRQNMAWRSSGSSNGGLIHNLARNGLIKAERVKEAMLGACESLLPFLHSNARVLDVGSGSGYLTHVLANLVAPDGVVTGVDHIQGLVDLSINNMKKNKEGQALLESKRVQFVKGDGRLGYKEGGIVLCFSIKERDDFLKTTAFRFIYSDATKSLPEYHNPDSNPLAVY
ncbi:hypothetical protein FGG08_003209 [Glutinoglossum americanum]|uniref:Uncharacterized protein n=1 Tax=Glutinoglossum americanum TaxID=1670608 RepID=A0A9P8I7M3_9PEZI|nr:hypothetical protein FGG08_003209 [Glutinoglossum americanum]